MRVFHTSVPSVPLLLACLLATACAPPGAAERSDAPTANATPTADPLPAPDFPPAAGPGGTPVPVGSDLAASTQGLSEAQLKVMFASAIEQARPYGGKSAVCYGIRDVDTGETRAAPATIGAYLERELKLPAFPASQCAFETFPFVIATREEAMLYTIRIDRVARDGVVTFWAAASYGNLGANAQEFRLERRGSGYVAVPTGVGVIS